MNTVIGRSSDAAAGAPVPHDLLAPQHLAAPERAEKRGVLAGTRLAVRRQDLDVDDAHVMLLDDVLYTLFRHKWLIVGCTCLGLCAAAGVRVLRPAPYTSTAKVMVLSIAVIARASRNRRYLRRASHSPTPQPHIPFPNQ